MDEQPQPPEDPQARRAAASARLALLDAQSARRQRRFNVGFVLVAIVLLVLALAYYQRSLLNRPPQAQATPDFDAVVSCRTAIRSIAHDPNNLEFGNGDVKSDGTGYTVLLTARGRNASNATRLSVFTCKLDSKFNVLTAEEAH